MLKHHGLGLEVDNIKYLSLYAEIDLEYKLLEDLDIEWEDYELGV